MVAESFELADVDAFDCLGVHVPVVVVRPQVDVAGVGVVQKMPDDDEDGSPDGDESLLPPAASGQASVASAEERVRLAGAWRKPATRRPGATYSSLSAQPA